MFDGLTQPTAVRVRADGRVFVAEKSGLSRSSTALDDHDADRLRRPADEGPTTSGTAACSGWRSTRSSRPSRTSTSSTRYDAAIGGTAPRWGTAGATSDPCPTPPGPTTDGCVVSGRLSRLTGSGDTHDGRRAGARSTTGASSSRATRIGALAFGAGRRALRERRRRRQLQRASTTASRHAGNPCGDPPGAGGAALRRRRPRAARCARRTCARRRAGRRSTGRVMRVDPRHGRGPARQPAGGELRPQRAPHRRLRPAQPVPLHDPARARARCGSATSAGTAGRRSTAWPTRPTGRRRTSAGPATRAPDRRPATTPPA